jgi:hypothetical protein
MKYLTSLTSPDFPIDSILTKSGEDADRQGEKTVERNRNFDQTSKETKMKSEQRKMMS